MKLSDLMRSAATTDPEEAQEVFATFQDYIKRNRFGLAKLGGPIRREIPALLQRIDRISYLLDLVEAGEKLENDT